MNLPDSPAMIAKTRPLCRLPVIIQQGILSGAVSLPTAGMLAAMGVDDGVALAKVFIDLNPSLNKQREILTLLKEISLRETVPISALIASGRINEILDNTDLNRSQKLQWVREYLRKRRYPAITQAEEAFEMNRKALALGSRIKMIPPKHFEGREYTLNLLFSSQAELVDLRRRIDSLVESPALKKILS